MNAKSEVVTNVTFTKEIEIPVPWGTIYARVWGDESSQPVLALHGLLHNAYSFDNLIPLLSQNYYYISVDLPGHGKSSPFPRGIPLEFINYVFCVKKIVDYLKWSKLIIIGHSLGAKLALFFASIYPERVLKIAMIDGATPVIQPPEKSVKHIRKHLDDVENVENTLLMKKPPSYSFEEALYKFQYKGNAPLTDAGANTMIAHSLEPSGSGYKFSADQRLKLFLLPLYSFKQIQNIVCGVKCPIILIVAEETLVKWKKIMGEGYHERLHIIFNLPNIQYKIVEGNHNVHIDHPERLAHHVNSFLLQVKSSL